MFDTVADESFDEKINSSYFKFRNDLSSLIMPLLRLLDPKIEVREVVEAIPHYCEELNITNFINLMVRLGFKCESNKISLKKIDQEKTPCVFVPEDGDSYIVSSVEHDIINIIKADGKKERLNFFESEGTIIYFSELKPDTTPGTWFQKILFRYKKLFMQIFIITVIYNALIVSVPLYVMSIYDKVLPAESVNMLLMFSCGIVIIVLFINFLSKFRTKAMSYIGARLEKSVGYVVVKDILYLPIGYTENTGVGNQIARIKDFDSIRDFLASPVLFTFLEIPTAIFFILVIYILGGTLAFIPVTLAAVFHFMYVMVNPILNDYIRKRALHHSLRQDFLLETLENIKDIKLTANMSKWEERLKNLSLDISSDGIKITNVNEAIGAISEFLMMFGGMLIVFFGAQKAIDNEISPGGLIAIMLLTWKVLQPIRFFFANLPRVDQIRNSIKQVNNLMKIKTEEAPRNNIRLLEKTPAKLELSRVSFKYHQSMPPALLGVSFVVNPGELLCITGTNGAGKTTILRLILGLYQPQAGNVLINGRNIKQFPQIQLRQSIAYQAQINKFFFGSIRQNLIFSNPCATMEEIIVATRLANIHNEIEALPDKYETKLGQQNDGIFSSSFLQRLVIARALLSHSNLVLFDEPEANLDAIASDKFLDTLKWIKHSKTIVMVTHRPSYLKVADKIINIQDGQVMQYGTPEQVLPHL